MSMQGPGIDGSSSSYSDFASFIAFEPEPELPVLDDYSQSTALTEEPTAEFEPVQAEGAAFEFDPVVLQSGAAAAPASEAPLHLAHGQASGNGDPIDGSLDAAARAMQTADAETRRVVDAVGVAVPPSLAGLDPATRDKILNPDPNVPGEVQRAQQTRAQLDALHNQGWTVRSAKPGEVKPYNQGHHGYIQINGKPADRPDQVPAEGARKEIILGPDQSPEHILNVTLPQQMANAREVEYAQAMKRIDPEAQATLEKSPTLKADVRELIAQGYRFERGPQGGGTYLDPGQRLIVIDSGTRGPAVVQALAHEVGHAQNPTQPDRSSKEAYVNGMLRGEADATIKNAQIRKEILANGGPDIGFPGNHAAQYQVITDQLLAGQITREQAVQQLVQLYGSEVNSKTGQTYTDYYGDSYPGP